MVPCYGDCTGMDEYYSRGREKRDEEHIKMLKERLSKANVKLRYTERLLEKVLSQSNKRVTQKRIAELEISREDLLNDHKDLCEVIKTLTVKNKKLKHLGEKAIKQLNKIVESL